MAQGSTYTYGVKYRNGNGIETATTTLSGVSFVSSGVGGGGGGTPTITSTSASSTQASTTTQATSTQNNTATTTTAVSEQPPAPSSQSQQAASASGQAKQVVFQQIRTQIAEVQKKLIIFISQLIQLLQAQLRQLQTQH